MKTKKDELLLAWLERKVTKDDFIKQYTELSNQKIINADYCLNLLNKSYKSEDTNDLEEAIVVGSTIDCFSNQFSEIFCKLLLADWHYSHEDIANILKMIKDPSTVYCLFQAVELKLEYLSYDDTYQFARKCIKALSIIDDDNAVNKLHLLTNSNNSKIVEYATKELRYKNF